MPQMVPAPKWLRRWRRFLFNLWEFIHNADQTVLHYGAISCRPALKDRVLEIFHLPGTARRMLATATAAQLAGSAKGMNYQRHPSDCQHEMGLRSYGAGGWSLRMCMACGSRWICHAGQMIACRPNDGPATQTPLEPPKWLKEAKAKEKAKAKAPPPTLQEYRGMLKKEEEAQVLRTTKGAPTAAKSGARASVPRLATSDDSSSLSADSLQQLEQARPKPSTSGYQRTKEEEVDFGTPRSETNGMAQPVHPDMDSEATSSWNRVDDADNMSIDMSITSAGNVHMAKKGRVRNGLDTALMIDQDEL